MRWLAVLALAPVPALAQPAPPSFKPVPPEYTVELPATSGAAAHGWGLYARVRGRDLDLNSRTPAWAQDPKAPKNDLEAGYGWWSGGASTVVGYIQHDYGSAIEPRYSFDAHNNPNEHRMGGSGVLGVGFVLHTP